MGVVLKCIVNETIVQSIFVGSIKLEVIRSPTDGRH